MNTLVVFDSQYGNTARLAQAIAEALRASGPAEALRVDPSTLARLSGVELLVVGSPTQGWQPTPVMRAFLASVGRAQLRGVAVACFDTRFRMPRWLSGSAARAMARTLRATGAALCAPPESFFVTGREGPLLDGELERAARWAAGLATTPASAAAPHG